MVEPPIWKIWSSNWIISPTRDKNKKYLKPPPSPCILGKLRANSQKPEFLFEHFRWIPWSFSPPWNSGELGGLVVIICQDVWYISLLIYHKKKLRHACIGKKNLPHGWYGVVFSPSQRLTETISLLFSPFLFVINDGASEITGKIPPCKTCVLFVPILTVGPCKSQAPWMMKNIHRKTRSFQ